MNRKEKVEFTKQALNDFERIERKATGEVGWIALKLSCSRKTAEYLVEAAKKEELTYWEKLDRELTDHKGGRS